MMDLMTREAAAAAPPSDAGDARPYHHGDLSRALVAAARTILERDGLAALSLRAVAREAGVSPAAPYHHFKDKSELLDAVAMEAFEGLGAAMFAAREGDPVDPLTAMGVAYVVYARENPSRYQVMYACSREKAKLPEDALEAKGPSPYDMVRESLIATGAVPADDHLRLEIAAGALWCAAHGLAEMASFEQFQPLIAACGGERPFYRAVLSQIGHLRDA